MIDLKKATLIGIGTNRAVYIHPKDKNQCIKVTVSNDFVESNREKCYYRFLEKRGIDWEHLARFNGVIVTNFGEGLVFELVYDYDAQISSSLLFYFKYAEEFLMQEKVFDKLKELKNYLYTNNIIVKDLSLTNILFQKINEKESRLVVIDGATNNDFIPLATYFPIFTRRKIERRWQKFIKHLRKTIGDRPEIKSLEEYNSI